MFRTRQLPTLNRAIAESLVGNRRTVQLANNTWLNRYDHEFVVTLHGNPIITIDRRNGEFTLSSAGWRTVTTKQRLNALTPFGIYQNRGEWFVVKRRDDGLWDHDNPIPFEDGMRLSLSPPSIAPIVGPHGIDPADQEASAAAVAIVDEMLAF